MAKNAEELLIFLFDEILPKHGMKLRTKQKELSLEMLRALQENRLALCEAEVGTGKTHAYILALTVYNIFSSKKAPAVISTSTIALQKALTEEYIPQISGILLEHHVINKPLSFAVRKGKKHYVCDIRLKIYETLIKNLQREADADLVLKLERLKGDNRIDLDDVAMTPYVKGRMNVLRCNRTCPYALLCRFMDYTVFLNSENSVCWIEKKENGRLALCAVPMELEHILYQDIWSRPIPVIITSGTMLVRGDFTHFKRTTGLQFSSSFRIMETSKSSPFDYQSHALLYIPERMPFPDIHDERYMQAVMEEIRRIVRATYGHTLILFTSYWLMERIYYGLRGKLSEFPLLLMGRGRLDIIKKFRNSGNGVLFASDSAGEGIDLAGDILSSLIVVKLPFPVPDAVMEYDRSQYETDYGVKGFDIYRKEVILPEMLIKLRQWFGRAIRRECDTAFFSILDSRASLRGKYRNEILNTLPTMPVTDSVEDVADFIIRKKADSYFMDKERGGK